MATKKTDELPNKRWSVVIKYHTSNERIDYFQIEELEELQDIVEAGPDFSYIKEIKIKYNLNSLH